jgi:hypothetical protein
MFTIRHYILKVFCPLASKSINKYIIHDYIMSYIILKCKELNLNPITITIDFEKLIHKAVS